MKDPNEKRTLTVLVLSMAVIWIWSAFFAPPPVPPVDAAAAPESAEVVPAPPVAPAPVADSTCKGERTVLASSSTELVATDCGGLAAITFPGVKSAVKANTWWGWLLGKLDGSSPGGWEPYGEGEGPESLLSEKGQALAVGVGERKLQAGGGAWTVTSADPLVQVRQAPEGYTVTRSILPGDKPDTWNVKVRVEASQAVPGPVWVGMVDEIVPGAATTNVRQLSAAVDGSLESLADPEAGCGSMFSGPLPQAWDEPVDWVGIGDHYFLAALAPLEGTSGTLELSRPAEGLMGAFFVAPTAQLTPGQPVELNFALYTGPKELGRLAEFGHALDEAASLGIFGLFAKILLFTLHMFQGVLGNWGLSILALTFLVRLSLYPLTRKAVVAGRKMQVLQPEMKALQERYADDKETLNRETMALFAKHGVNPLGGCFPILVQMPVFFALYAAISYEPALFHANFLYLQDLSSPDPYGLLGVLIVLGMYAQQSMTPMTGMDPAQQQMMKLMPLFFGFMMFSMPAGLSLYYTLNTVLAIVQQWYNTRSIPHPSPGVTHVSS